MCDYTSGILNADIEKAQRHTAWVHPGFNMLLSMQVS